MEGILADLRYAVRALAARAERPITRQLLGLTDPYGANAPLAASAGQAVAAGQA